MKLLTTTEIINHIKEIEAAIEYLENESIDGFQYTVCLLKQRKKLLWGLLKEAK